MSERLTGSAAYLLLLLLLRGTYTAGSLYAGILDGSIWWILETGVLTVLSLLELPLRGRIISL